MEDIKIISGYFPGLIGRITELHATYYSEKSGFGLFFESKVGTELIDFLNQYEDSRDGIWLALCSDIIIGSIIIDGIRAREEGAHLRWFILAPEYQNKGIRSKLIQKAIEFCKKLKYSMIYLWTFKRLDVARHIYEKHGFRLIKESEGNQWGKVVIEQRNALKL